MAKLNIQLHKTMQTQITFSFDAQTVILANRFAQKKGVSLNELLELYLKQFAWNENSILLENKKNKNTVNNSNTANWNELEQFLSQNRFHLPHNYKFDRNELYGR